MVAINSQVTPMPNESESQFAFRAHHSLMATVRDPNQRNKIVWNAWDQARGNYQRDRAVNYFSPDQYRHVPEVCYFYEHSTTGRNGLEHKYSFADLAAIVESQKKREDTDCYSAIASHHTSDFAKGPALEPTTVGYSGVYRLGMVDQQEPKWAIFADEFHRKDQAKLFNDRRRRSVEVLRFRDGRAPILDPIATLGVDSPRLNLPVARYEGEEEGIIERYSFMSMASVGANSSYIPGTETKKYEADGGQGSAFGGGRLSQDDIASIVSAIRSTPEMEWCKQQMQKAQTNDSQQPGAAPANLPAQPQVGQYGSGGDQLALPPAQPQPPQQVQSAMPLAGAPLAPQTALYSAQDEDEVSQERYAALEAENTDLKEKYSRLSEANKNMMANLQQQNQAIQNLEKRACDADRIELIQGLCEKYQHTGVFDRASLMETCLYSHGNDMSHETFVSKMETLEDAAKRVSVTLPTAIGMIPEGSLAAPANDVDRYSAIMDRHAENRPDYAGLDYDQIEQKMIAAGELPPLK